MGIKIEKKLQSKIWCLNSGDKSGWTKVPKGVKSHNPSVKTDGNLTLFIQVLSELQSITVGFSQRVESLLLKRALAQYFPTFSSIQNQFSVP